MKRNVPYYDTNTASHCSLHPKVDDSNCVTLLEI